jgi:hypothetical protein
MERVKALGRIALRLAKDGELLGAIFRDGEEKYLGRRDEGPLCIDLLEPYPRSTDPTDFSELELSAGRCLSAGTGSGSSRPSPMSRAGAGLARLAGADTI